LDDSHRTVLIHVTGRARLAADVEPEARGDATALVLAELYFQVRMVLRYFDGLQIADIGPGRPVRRLGAVLGGVHLAQTHRVDVQLASQLIHAALSAERRIRRARRAIGGNL